MTILSFKTKPEEIIRKKIQKEHLKHNTYTKAKRTGSSNAEFKFKVHLNDGREEEMKAIQMQP